LTTGSPGAPEVVELLAAASGKGPSTILRYDPREMTIAEWVRVLTGTRGGKAAAPPAPAWLGPIALHALGFHGIAPEFETARRWLRWPRPNQVGIPDLDEWSRVQALFARGGLFAGAPPTVTLVVVRRTASPKLGAMLPTPRLAALVATIDELDAIVLGDREVSPLPLIAPTEEQVVAVEMEPEQPSKLEGELYPALAAAMSRPWIVHVYAQDRGREMRHPYVVNPSSLTEIVAVAEKEKMPLPRKPEAPPRT
jgi:hypothetical protein